VQEKPEVGKKVVQMWLSVDPMAHKLPSMSAYMYCAGNPVRLIDPDGRIFIDANNNRVNVKVGKNGSLDYRFSKGTSDGVRNEFLNNHSPALSALANTKDGRSAIKFMNNISTEIEIKPDNQNPADRHSTVSIATDKNGNVKMYDGVYDKVTIIPHMGSINETAREQNVDVDEILGAVMMVESGHLGIRQIPIDQKNKTESEQYENLLNDYIDFRYNYRTGKNQKLDKTIFKNNSGIDIKLNKQNQQRFNEIE